MGHATVASLGMGRVHVRHHSFPHVVMSVQRVWRAQSVISVAPFPVPEFVEDTVVVMRVFLVTARAGVRMAGLRPCPPDCATSVIRYISASNAVSHARAVAPSHVAVMARAQPR